MSKQTAVELLIDKLSNYDLKMIELFSKEIEQALALEKQQIIDAWINGDARICETKSIPYAEEYYNKTFKQQEQ
jgi:hypothetical protein